MFSPSAKLDYRFVVQVIRSLLLFMPFSSVAIEHISYLIMRHQAPNSPTPTRTAHTTFIRTTHSVIALLYSHVQLSLDLCYFLFIYMYFRLNRPDDLRAEAKENPNNRNADEKTRIKIII